jgi:hypothetical protein
MATSLPSPRAARLRPPSPAYSPSEFSRLLEAVVGHHRAVLGVVVRFPGEVLPLEREPAVGGRGERREDVAAGPRSLPRSALRCWLNSGGVWLTGRGE